MHFLVLCVYAYTRTRARICSDPMIQPDRSETANMSRNELAGINVSQSRKKKEQRENIQIVQRSHKTSIA